MQKSVDNNIVPELETKEAGEEEILIRSDAAIQILENKKINQANKRNRKFVSTNNIPGEETPSPAVVQYKSAPATTNQENNTLGVEGDLVKSQTEAGKTRFLGCGTIIRMGSTNDNISSFKEKSSLVAKAVGKEIITNTMISASSINQMSTEKCHTSDRSQSTCTETVVQSYSGPKPTSRNLKTKIILWLKPENLRQFSTLNNKEEYLKPGARDGNISVCGLEISFSSAPQDIEIKFLTDNTEKPQAFAKN